MTSPSGAIVPDFSSLPPEADEQARMAALIDMLSAYIEQFHGGLLELVSFDGEVLRVSMAGNCRGCRLSAVTLHGWVEGTVRPFFPNLKQVESV